MVEGTITKHPRWLRVLPGALLVAVVIVIITNTWDVLLANNPFYPATLAIALGLGLVLVLSGLRPRQPAKSGAVRGVLRTLAALAAVGLAGVLFWLQPFPAEPRALEALESDDSVTVTDTLTRTIYEPVGVVQTGFVLYPGARVDPRAYAALSRELAEQGSRVVVLKCPYDLALLCADAAEGYLTDSLTWSVGGHSLGGVAASQFVARNGLLGGVDGLVLWASYPLDDLGDRDDLVVASISGSNDGLTTPQDVASRRDLLPPDTVYTEIEGAIHAFFGDYGSQSGDGQPTIDREVAQEQIVEATRTALAETGE